MVYEQLNINYYLSFIMTFYLLALNSKENNSGRMAWMFIVESSVTKLMGKGMRLVLLHISRDILPHSTSVAHLSEY